MIQSVDRGSNDPHTGIETGDREVRRSPGSCRRSGDASGLRGDRGRSLPQVERWRTGDRFHSPRIRRIDSARMKILERLPIYDEPTLIDVQGEVYQIWKNQAILWVSFAESLTPFPAILDTGHSHNLSIARRHVNLWGRPDAKQIGQ